MANTFRGKAVVVGTAFTCDVILYPIATSLKLNHTFEENVLQDEQGDDTSWRANNEKYEGDLGMLLIDKTGPTGSTAAHAKAGAVFLSPLAILTISTCDVAAWNTTYQLVSGSDIDLQNKDAGKMSYKLRRYVNTAQNALAAFTPG